jgi:hypothetical protein
MKTNPYLVGVTVSKSPDHLYRALMLIDGKIKVFEKKTKPKKGPNGSN